MQSDSFGPDEQRLVREIFDAMDKRESEIGETLHDTLCQTLSGAALMATVLERRAASGEAVSAAELAQISEMLDRSLDSARALSNRLEPLQGSATALMSALERLAADTARTVSCEFHCEDPVLVNDGAVGLTLYRIAEDAVRNGLGPPPAARIQISLTTPDGSAEVAVCAYGAGSTGAIGEDRLKLMRYRAAAAGARLSYEPLADGGTRVACSLPLKSI